jgi:hypothetical protein
VRQPLLYNKKKSITICTEEGVGEIIAQIAMMSFE